MCTSLDVVLGFFALFLMESSPLNSYFPKLFLTITEHLERNNIPIFKTFNIDGNLKFPTLHGCSRFYIIIVIYLLTIRTNIFQSPSTAVPLSDDRMSEDNHQLKQSFDKLLYELVDLNLERLKAINRVLKLQTYPQGLRSSAEERGEDHNVLPDNHSMILFLVNRKNINENNDSSEQSTRPPIAYLRPKYERDSSEEGLGISLPNEDAGLNGSFTETAERKAILRGLKSCRKSSIKACTKACKSASKDVCKDYKCSRRMEKAFKKECKKNCKDKFD